MKIEELRYWIPDGKKRCGIYTFRFCDCCTVEVGPLDEELWRLAKPPKITPGERAYLCDICYKEWKEQNRDVLIAMEMME